MTGPWLGLALVSLAAGGQARAEGPSVSDPAQLPDKKRAQVAEGPNLRGEEREAWQRELDARLGEEPEELINIYNFWTKETLALPPDDDLEVGEDLSRALVDEYFRCRFTEKSTEVDERLVSVLIRAAVRFDVDRVEVISGYRSDKHNLNLRKKGRNVARNSQHTHGTAVDFRLPGVPVSRLHRWARSLELGGVGYYPTSGFIHVDTAEVRYWTIR